jgi:hypothetical protein
MFEHKYLKYRQKYINLKKELSENKYINRNEINELKGGNNNKNLDIMNVTELSDTPISSVHNDNLSLFNLNKLSTNKK